MNFLSNSYVGQVRLFVDKNIEKMNVSIVLEHSVIFACQMAVSSFWALASKIACLRSL